MKNALIRIRSKPVKPELADRLRRFELFDSVSLCEVVAEFDGYDLKEVRIDYDFDSLDERVYSFVGKRKESEEEFQEKLNSYYTSMDSYDRWYRENEWVIIEELERRSKIEQRKDKNNKLNESLRIAEEIKRLQVKLDSMMKEVGDDISL